MILTSILAAALAQGPACEPPPTLTPAQLQALLPDPATASLQSSIEPRRCWAPG